MPGYNKRKDHFQDYRVNIGNVADIESSKKPPKTREELIEEELKLKRKMLSSIEDNLEQDRQFATGKIKIRSSNLSSEKTPERKTNKTDHIEKNGFEKKQNASARPFIIVIIVFIVLIIGSTYFDVGLGSNESLNGNVPVENTQINEPVTIYFQDFKSMVQGKTEDQVKDMLGNPDEAQEVIGVKMWYYRKGSNNIRIMNEDTEKEVDLVLIQFLSGSVYSINAL